MQCALHKTCDKGSEPNGCVKSIKSDIRIRELVLYYRMCAHRVYWEHMITLILILLVGAIFVYIAQSNLAPVTLHLGATVITNIPLFYVIIGSILTGLIVAYLIHLVNSIFIAFSLRGKDSKIKEAKNEIANLTKRIHQLELDNERLKNNSSADEPEDKNAL